MRGNFELRIWNCEFVRLGKDEVRENLGLRNADCGFEGQRSLLFPRKRESRDGCQLSAVGGRLEKAWLRSKIGGDYGLR